MPAAGFSCELFPGEHVMLAHNMPLADVLPYKVPVALPASLILKSDLACGAPTSNSTSQQR